MNDKLNKIYIFIIITILFSGCASKTVDLMPKKISEEDQLKYKEYSCNQIDNTLSFLEKKAQRLARIQNDNASSDRAIASWGWILYGVPYLFMDGNGEIKEEFEILLGKKEALEELAIEKDCKFNKVNYHHTYEGNY